MGFADRLRDATRPTNSIEAVQAPVQARATGLHGASPAPVSDPSAPASKAAERAALAGKKPAYASETEVISRSYYVEDKGGERRYFDDYQRKGLAMRSTETTISSKREDLNTVKAMMEVAASRGWHTIEVKGSAEFKREAWIEAQTRGIEARGYRANDLDRQEADRRRSERGPVNEVRTPLPAPQSTSPAAPAAKVQGEPAPTDRAAGEAAKPASGPSQARKSELAKGEAAKPMPADHGRTVRQAQAELSPDGRTMLAAVSSMIDRQMNKLHSEAKAEMKAHVAFELMKKERAEGPVVLKDDHRRALTAPEPTRTAREALRPAPEQVRRLEPEAPRLSRSR
jgi:hypothetical protein